jgi:glycosyltransferase involved in cell wall biosynthesis
MTRRNISVHQTSPGSAVGDGAVDSILLVRQMAAELGFNSEIFVDGDEGSWPAPVRRTSELQPRAHDLMLIHHCGCQERLEWLAGLRCRKALVYHGLTPPRYFANDSRDRLRSVTAHAQLATLRGLVEASIALSHPAAEGLRQRGFARVTAMPLFPDWSDLRFAGYRDPVDLDRPPGFRIVNIGQIAGDNHQRDLVRLVDRLGSIGGIPIELILMGQGEPDRRYRAELEGDIRGSGLGDRIVVTDAVSENALAGYCRTANAYLSLSERDTAASSIFAAMTLDLPVVAYAAPGIADLLGDAAVLVRDRDPATLRDALYRVHQDRRFRRELIARQRDAACGERRDRMRQEFRQWLLAIGAGETRPLVARLVGWRAPTSRVRGNPAPADGLHAFSTSRATPSSAIHYIIEAPLQSSWPLEIADRQLALALGRLPERTVSIVPAEGAANSAPEVIAEKLPGALDDLVGREPGRAERIVTIRRSHPPNPVGMLGDVRLLQVTEAESTIAAPLAGLINLHLDAVLVASQFAERAVRNSGVNLPIVVAGRGVDDIIGSRAIAEHRAARGPVREAAPFTYLYLDCALAASSVEEVLTAYSLAFTSADPVLLVISAANHVQDVIDFWVRRLAGGMFSPPVQILPEALTAAESELLYRLADSAILPILGDELNPAAIALASGLRLIAANWGGHLDYCDDENATLIDCAFDVATDAIDLPARPRVRLSVPGLIAAMKAAYRDGRDPDTSTARRARRGQADSAGLRWLDVAKKIDDFIVSLDQRPVMNRKIRLAWVSTYNSRCGLATHSEHLLEHFDRQVFDVTVIGNHQEPLKPDPANLVRLWPDRSGSLGSVRDFIRKFDAVFVNFHFSLMEIHDLAETLKTAQVAGIDTYVTLHKTLDTVIGGRAVSLNEIAEVLRACTRLIVHTEADIAQLKSFGIVDNVVMIPPGVIDQPALSTATVRSLLSLQQFHPIVGTFGFLLPPKGLQQLIHAFALVLRHFPAAMLMMLNAEFPGAAESVEECNRCRALIRELGLEDRVRLIDEFLETDEILLLLNACDMTVFAYQNSGESDSGAVRLGLAAGRPVATTPLGVFANLAGIVHQFAGKTAADIAEGIVALLRAPDLAARLVQQQQDWIGRNSWAAQATRIGNIMRGCFAARHAVELRPPVASGPDRAVPEADAERAASGAMALREMIELVEAADESAKSPMPGVPDAAAIGAAEERARQAR